LILSDPDGSVANRYSIYNMDKKSNQVTFTSARGKVGGPSTRDDSHGATSRPAGTGRRGRDGFKLIFDATDADPMRPLRRLARWAGTTDCRNVLLLARCEPDYRDAGRSHAK
jgi:hypothetical protein